MTEKAYVILLRGINVGGKNLVPMAGLKACLEKAGFSDVSTFIASGNAIVTSALSPAAIQKRVETALPKAFKLDSERIKVLVLSRTQLQDIVARKPKGFGDQPAKYHSDVIFLMGLTAAQAMPIFSPKEGVDAVWPDKGVVYSQRLSAKRTQSRLNRIMTSPMYKSMTIRTWNTTTKLLELLKKK